MKRQRLVAVITLTVAALILVSFATTEPGRASASEVPIAVDDHYTASQGAKLLVDSPGAMGNDVGAAGHNWIIISRPTHGIYSTAGTTALPGVFTYVSDAAYVGDDSFTYCIGEGDGTPCESNVATVAISVKAAVPVDDFYTIDPGAKLLIDKPGVAENDENVDLRSHYWTVTRKPSNGTFVPGGSVPGGSFAFAFTPDVGYSGTTSFEYCVSLATGSSCISSTATAYIQVGAPVVSRIGGADRFEVAAHIAQRTHPAGASTLFIATGGNYPDALSAAPAAVRQGAPLLLVTKDEVPSATATEVSRLTPGKIILIGGPNSISDGVASRLGTLAPTATVTRISGVDRYEVSRATALDAFGVAAHGYVATGANFPDALSAGGAAGSAAEPVILVNGAAPTTDAATNSTLATLGTSALTIVGGANSVSPGIEGSLKSSATVTRAAGADRFEASYNVNHSAFTAATTVYLATGSNYPDALVGGVIAGRNHSPLYVVHPDCVPTSVLHEIVRLGARNVVLIGGTNSLSNDVQQLTACP